MTNPGSAQPSAKKLQSIVERLAGLFSHPALTGPSGEFILLAASGGLLVLVAQGGVGRLDWEAWPPVLAGLTALFVGLHAIKYGAEVSARRFHALSRVLPACALFAAYFGLNGGVGSHSLPFLLGLAGLMIPVPILLPPLLLSVAVSIPLTLISSWPSAWMNFCAGVLVAACIRFFNEMRYEELRGALHKAYCELSDKSRVESQLQKSQERVLKKYENLFESAPDIIFTIQTDGRIASLNPGFESMTGLSSREWIGRPLSDLLHPSDQQRASRALEEVFKGKSPPALEMRFLCKEKTHLQGALTLKPQIEDGQVSGALGFARDLSQGKKYARALQDSEERFALVAHSTNDGLWDWNIKTRRFYFSPRWKQMLGYEDQDIGSSPEEWFNRVHPEDIQELRAAVLRHLHGQTPHFEATYRIRNQANQYRWMSTRGLAVRDNTGSAYRMVGSQTDITDFKQAEEQLTRDLSRDPLTRLPNRTFLIERLGEAIDRAEGDPDYSFALLSLNLDRFTLVNDSLGHDAGDQALALAARRLQSCLRNGDLLARLGGDEFAVLADGIRDKDQALRLAERIRKGFRNSFNLRGQRVFLTAGIGIAIGRDYRKPVDILRDATMAMTRAKAQGKGRHEVFNFEMRAEAVERLLMENDLRRAIKRQEFIIHYQPIVNLASAEIVGFEALVRWQHPDQGLIPPAEFLSLAEETGLIIPLGWWVFEEACRQTRRWQSQFTIDKSLSISVNLSAKNLVQPDCAQRVARILQKTELDPKDLKLEITEEAIQLATSAVAMKRLKSMGIEFYLDDFGKGLFPLRNLRSFPIDVAKIDCSFVARMGQKPGATQIVQAMVGLSHSLGLKVAAEGVENADQAAQLRLLRCELAQGFLYSKPLDAGSAERLLSSLYGPRGSATQRTLPVYAVGRS